MQQQTRIERSMAGDAPWLVLSPHLDDAVLSCGALMEAEAQRRQITVVTLFTEASTVPHTRAARSFLGQCGISKAGQLFEARQAEDRAVLDGMGVQHLHLGAVDALFRKREPFRKRKPIRFVERAWNKLPPELTHRYPTYRFDIALGRVAAGDHALIDELRNKVAGLMARTEAELLFCPVGVGKHVDHLITREAGSAHPDSVVLYSDFPYDLASPPDTALLERRGFQPWTWEKGIVSKPSRIREYATQADALFPGGEIPVRAETYFVTD
ncbi:PIG-L family deacetylase [Paenarthrobacter sp. NPDC089322]|uniref:PIG-L deacetylase family protein n=1 Tax=Paenarthrobacter sp. NPDC089322 TaxID=3155065 RepID=UPI00343EA87C